MTASAAEVLQAIPETALARPLQIETLQARRPGRSNHRLQTSEGRHYYLKIHQHSEGFSRETTALERIPKGVGPSLVWADERYLAFITAEVPGYPVIDSTVPAATIIERCLSLFRLLLGVPVGGPVDPIPAPGPELRPYLGDLAVRLGRPASALAVLPWITLPLHPCHGDLVPHNIRVTDREIRLIDFEYFGLSQAMFDAASLCLSPTLVVAPLDRVALLRRFAQAVTDHRGTPVTGAEVVAAAILWAIRFAERLHTRATPMEREIPWQSPLEIAAQVLDHIRPDERSAGNGA